MPPSLRLYSPPIKLGQRHVSATADACLEIVTSANGLIRVGLSFHVLEVAVSIRRSTCMKDDT